MEELSQDNVHHHHIKQNKKQKNNYIINVEIRVEWQRRKNQDAGGKLITINF
jgi:hypothetical protein